MIRTHMGMTYTPNAKTWSVDVVKIEAAGDYCTIEANGERWTWTKTLAGWFYGWMVKGR